MIMVSSTLYFSFSESQHFFKKMRNILFFLTVDVEGNQKLQLKYKCHTMKKLNMTRTLLIEKKEGDENTGDFQILELHPLFLKFHFLFPLSKNTL